MWYDDSEYIFWPNIIILMQKGLKAVILGGTGAVGKVENDFYIDIGQITCGVW